MSENSRNPIILHRIDVPIDQFPVETGQIIFTSEGQIFVDLSAGRMSYSAFEVVTDMLALNSMVKYANKLYCVGNQLYRWNGSSLIEIGGAVTPISSTELNQMLGAKGFPVIV